MFNFIGDIKAEFAKLHAKIDALLAAPKEAVVEVKEGVTVATSDASAAITKVEEAPAAVVEDVKKEV